LKSGKGNGGPATGSNRRSMGVKWGAVRAFCERIGMRGKRDSGGDPWPVKGARRMASWRINGRGRGPVHNVEWRKEEGSGNARA
jgi:hypothetical protein